jgi:predicted dehydrogenase
MDEPSSEPLKLGIVGCAEGTHGKVWAELLVAPEGREYGMQPARVWDADPAASQVVAGTTGAEAVHDFRAAGDGVDGVLITELLPTRYLELSRPFLLAGKRVFLNRPLAGSVGDAHCILELARDYGASVYSASALYHTAAGDKARRDLASLGPIRLFSVTGPTDHIGFYLPHAIAALISVLGTGIVRVQALSLEPSVEQMQHAAAPVVVYVEYGKEATGGPARGVIEMVGPASPWYGFVLKLFGANAEAPEIRFEVSYDPLLRTMATFFRTGVEPVP